MESSQTRIGSMYTSTTTSHLHNGILQQRNFYKYIAETYGKPICDDIRTVARSSREIAKVTCQKAFLIECRRNDVLPPHIYNVSKNLQHLWYFSNTGKTSYQKALTKFQSKILNITIEDISIHLFQLNKKLSLLKNKLASILPVDIINKFIDMQHTHDQKIRNELSVKHNGKLRSLIENSSEHLESNTSELPDICQELKSKWIQNFTNTDIPRDVLEILSLGIKFNTQAKMNNRENVELIKNLEHMLWINNCTNDVQNKVRDIVVNEMLHSNRKKYVHVSTFERCLQQKIRATSEFLKNENVFVTFADKGNVTVLMNRESYETKMNTMLSDVTTYESLSRNPINKVRAEAKEILHRWNNNKYLKREYSNFTISQTDTVLAKIYGLPKIHKVDIPLRPIVSCIGTPFEFLSKFISQILKNSLPTPRSRIKNSVDLKDKLRTIVVPADHVMISIDVTSLFTNVGKERIKTSITKNYVHISKQFNIPLDELLEAVDKIMENSYFQFDGRYYKQIYGTAMGNPCSGDFADMVMVDLEESCLDLLDFQPVCYYRYVDDSLSIIPKTKISHMLNVFNSADPRIKFTYEVEVDQTINFLELSIRHTNGNIEFDWYHKPTFSGRILNFHSSHPKSQKIAMVYNLVDRSLLLADKKHHKKNLQFARHVLLANSYPEKFVDKFIRKRIAINTKKSPPSSNTVDNETQTEPCHRPSMYLKVPYNQKLFQNLSHRLKEFNIAVVPSLCNNFGRFIRRGKDITEPKHRKSVVYKINCQGCDVAYVGQTKKSAVERAKQHFTNSKDPNKECAINTHTKTFGHAFDFENPIVLDYEKDWIKRITSETIHINLYPQLVNKNEDSRSLSKLYAPIIQKMKEKNELQIPRDRI